MIITQMHINISFEEDKYLFSKHKARKPDFKLKKALNRLGLHKALRTTQHRTTPHNAAMAERYKEEL
jgi:hypothetical protein